MAEGELRHQRWVGALMLVAFLLGTAIALWPELLLHLVGIFAVIRPDSHAFWISLPVRGLVLVVVWAGTGYYFWANILGTYAWTYSHPFRAGLYAVGVGVVGILFLLQWLDAWGSPVTNIVVAATVGAALFAGAAVGLNWLREQPRTLPSVTGAAAADLAAPASPLQANVATNRGIDWDRAMQLAWGLGAVYLQYRTGAALLTAEIKKTIPDPKNSALTQPQLFIPHMYVSVASTPATRNVAGIIKVSIASLPLGGIFVEDTPPPPKHIDADRPPAEPKPPLPFAVVRFPNLEEAVGLPEHGRQGLAVSNAEMDREAAKLIALAADGIMKVLEGCGIEVRRSTRADIQPSMRWTIYVDLVERI